MAFVHCFRCDDVVEVDTSPTGPLWCPACDDTVLGPPGIEGDGTVWWSAAGLTLGGRDGADDVPDDYRFFRRRGAGGTVMGAAMLGLQQALFGKVDDDQVIESHDDDPDRDEDLEVHLDAEHPSDSWVRFRDDGD